MKKQLLSFLPDRYKSLNIEIYDTLASTNTTAKEFAVSGCPLPLLVIAKKQTAGRGRQGKSFYSPKDTGIYMSLTIGDFPSPEQALFLTSAAAVAVTDAIFTLTGKSTGIKWVNDIYLEGKKIGGILAEAQMFKNNTAITVGIGINMSTHDFPEDISGIAGSLKSDVSFAEMIAQITKNLLDLSTQSADSFFDKYRSRSLLLGKEIYFLENGVKTSAEVLDIASDFGLVVKTSEGETKTLRGGEITVRMT